jgi:hypothetical protein
MNRQRTALLAALGAAAIATSACSTSVTGQANAGQVIPPATRAADSPATTTSSTGPAKTTPPGTKLKLGARAVVSSSDGTIAITVTAIEAGDKAAFDQKYGDKAKEITPYYIRFTVENVDGSDMSFTSSPSLHGDTADGTGTGVIVTGEVGDCTDDGAPKDFKTAGASYQACKLAGGTAVDKVTAATYDATDSYDGNPIVWQK